MALPGAAGLVLAGVSPSVSGFTWNLEARPPARSISASAPCAVSPTRRQIADCQGRTSPLIGVRTGNWLTPEQSQQLWNTPEPQQLNGRRNRELLAVLLACGLRFHEAVDLKGKGGHTRTMPMPKWVKAQLDEWPRAANLIAGSYVAG